MPLIFSYKSVGKYCSLEFLNGAFLVPNAKLNQNVCMVLLNGHINEEKTINRKIISTKFPGSCHTNANLLEVSWKLLLVNMDMSSEDTSLTSQLPKHSH